MSDNANLWLDAYNKAIEGKFERNLSKNKIVDVLGSISTQINSFRIEDKKLREDYKDLNEINESLEIQLSQKSESLIQTEFLLNQSNQRTRDLENDL